MKLGCSFQFSTVYHPESTDRLKEIVSYALTHRTKSSKWVLCVEFPCSTGSQPVRSCHHLKFAVVDRK